MQHAEAIPAQLLAAISRGQSVDVAFVADNTRILRWSVDGEGVIVHCVEFETRTPSMRAPVCGQGS